MPCISWQTWKIYFTQSSVYILDDINEQDISFLECKQKHMMKRGAPPDKVGILYHMVTYRISWFQAELISKGYHTLVPDLILIFLKTVSVPLNKFNIGFIVSLTS